MRGRSRTTASRRNGWKERIRRSDVIAIAMAACLQCSTSPDHPGAPATRAAVRIAAAKDMLPLACSNGLLPPGRLVEFTEKRYTS